MKKPDFKYSKLCYAVSAVLTIPLLIDICTACRLFPLWLAWLLLILIGLISIVRLWFAFRQHLYKFAWGLIGQLLLGTGVLIFFQLSINRVIETPVSNPIAPAVVDITDPFLELDSTHNKAGEPKKEPAKPAKREDQKSDKEPHNKKK